MSSRARTAPRPRAGAARRSPARRARCASARRLPAGRTPGGRAKAMPDAVVVGAGPNGLVAANILADAGWSVEVLEAQDEPGGAVRSDRGVDPDFVSDVFSAFYPLAA